MDTDLIYETVHKMLENKDPHENILAFMDKMMFPAQMESLYKQIAGCKSCGLCDCNHTPFTGNIYSEIMFIGEGPGEQEEKQGIPFVGPAGELLTRMLDNAGVKINPRWSRENVFITNTVHCRPTADGKNRQPGIQEIAMCKRFLDKEIELIKPKVIICVGAVAADTFIHPNFKITEQHGKFFGDSPKLIAIYHPSYVLRKGENTDEGKQLKKDMWQDLLAVEEYLKG